MRRGFQWDLARQLERFDWLLQQLPRYADWGYQELHLHLEDAVAYPSLPGVARPGALSYRQLERLVAEATRRGIEVCPIVNLLGHTQYLLKVPALRDLNELREPDGSPSARGQISPLHPRTLEVAEGLLRDMAPVCTAGKVHVGLDESYHLGRHPKSRAEIARIGLARHFARYVGRLHGLAQGHGLRLALWADMLAFLPEAIPLLPTGTIAYDWYYYPFGREPRLEIRNFAPYDLAPALRARGIEYWGCPMSGAFRHEPLPIFRERLGNIVSWWRRCQATQAEGMLITAWEPQRLAAELPAAVEAAAAGLWLDRETDPERLWKSGCRRAFGTRGKTAASALWAADRHPFSGYARWQANERWDVLATPASLSPWRAEAVACRVLARRSGLPPAAGASLRFRAYLAERDRFIRAAGQAVWALRATRGDGATKRRLERERTAAAAFGRTLADARGAARAMWRRTRDARIAGPNEALVRTDAVRLRQWQDWLERARRDPRRLAEAAPVMGARQLLFRARNFAPAAQKIMVEARDASGAWREVHGCFLIEFQARAARPRTRLIQDFSIPVPADPIEPAALRISVRGFGRVGLRDIILYDGVRRWLPISRRERLLGQPAPRRGYPDFDWQKPRGAWVVARWRPAR